MDATLCFAVPGEPWIIDIINPSTGKSWINGETLEEIKAKGGEYSKAVMIPLEQWQQERAAQQDTPIEWKEITEERYYDMLYILPPEIHYANGFLVGEPSDHHAVTGAPRFAAFVQYYGAYKEASRPLTKKEFRELFGN